MAHVIEPAKSSRAACRKCRQKIEKGELRFGEEVDNAFGEGNSYRWYHLSCAAQARPKPFAETLVAFRGEIPQRAELERTAAGARARRRPDTFPYAEHAPSGRASCLQCGDKIAKGELRVAVEREVDAGDFVRSGAGYLHPGCAIDYTDDHALLERLRANSTGLGEAELGALAELL